MLKAHLSLHLISNRRISLLLLAVLVEENNDKDSHGYPNDHAHGDEASLCGGVMLV